MSQALKQFAILDNSTRPNVLLNCEHLKNRFEDEDMKTIEYASLIRKTNTDIIPNYYYIKNCNLFVFVTKVDSLLQSIQSFIFFFKPIYIVTISTSDESEKYLNEINYKFVEKINALHVYQRN